MIGNLLTESISDSILFCVLIIGMGTLAIATIAILVENCFSNRQRKAQEHHALETALKESNEAIKRSEENLRQIKEYQDYLDSVKNEEWEAETKICEEVDNPFILLQYNRYTEQWLKLSLDDRITIITAYFDARLQQINNRVSFLSESMAKEEVAFSTAILWKTACQTKETYEQSFRSFKALVKIMDTHSEAERQLLINMMNKTAWLWISDEVIAEMGSKVKEAI